MVTSPRLTTTLVSVPDRLKVLPSAYKWGVTGDQMLHAMRYSRRVIPQDDYKRLYLGPDPAGNLLEVVAVHDDDPRVIHAMPLRPAFYRYL